MVALLIPLYSTCKPKGGRRECSYTRSRNGYRSRSVYLTWRGEVNRSVYLSNSEYQRTVSRYRKVAYLSSQSNYKSTYNGADETFRLMPILDRLARRR